MTSTTIHDGNRDDAQRGKGVAELLTTTTTMTTTMTTTAATAMWPDAAKG